MAIDAIERDVREDVKERKTRDAGVAEKMADSGTADPLMPSLAASKGKHFLECVRKSCKDGVVVFDAKLGSRMMINMAGGVIENAGIALDRCLGLPFIPGSAVKGISRAQALWEIKAETDATTKKEKLRFAMLIFGFGGQDIKGQGAFAWAGGEPLAKEIAATLATEDFKGSVCFLPAYPTTNPGIVVDMVNTHYPEYYRGRRQQATDDEPPIPNYFPAVKEGTSFGFALIINRVPSGVTKEEILDRSKTWLQNALTEKGVGAKTAAGYGWFDIGAVGCAQQNQGVAQPSGATALTSDYTDKTFPNAVLNKLNPGQLDSLKQEIEKLKKSENVEWLNKLKSALTTKEQKDIRKRLSGKDWFPKEWLPQPQA